MQVDSEPGSPAAVRTALRHLPALDGLRAVAVGAVLLFHSGFGWASGGFLGVTLFFVLSGYLIGGLLLTEHDASGTIDLRRFWSRRCRRLAPGVLVLVALVALVLRERAASAVGDGIASLTWVANWRFVFDHQSYTDLFTAPTPFQHMWSLAIEEQFYLVLPVVSVVLLRRGGRRLLTRVVLAGVVASTIAAAALHAVTGDAGRAYYGTDARVAEPLVGVLLALVLVTPLGRRALGDRARRILDRCALGAVVALGALVVVLTERSEALYRGGFLVAALLSAVVVAAAAQPGSATARALAIRPLTAIGRISYGVYLFHWPVFLWLTPVRVDLDGPALLLLRSAVTGGIAWASYSLVEDPIRRGALSTRVALAGWANAGVALVVVLALTQPTTIAIAGFTDGVRTAGAVPTVPPTSASPNTSALPGTSVTTSTPSLARSVTSTMAARTVPRKKPTRRATATTVPSLSTAAHVPAASSPRTTPPAAAPTTVLPRRTATGPVRVAVVGDSMAAGLAAGLLDWATGRDDVVVYDLSTASCPLSAGGGSRHFPDGSEFGVRGECSWWTEPTSDRMQKYLAFDPDVVVAQDAMNALLDRKLASWPSYRKPSMPEQDRWLLDQYASMATALTTKGARVLLLDAVCADWWQMGTHFASFVDGGEGDARVAAMVRLNRSVSGRNLQPVEFGARLCPNGTFTQDVEGVSGGRPDGYHLSVDAADALAAAWLGPLAIRSRPLPT